MKCKVLAAAAAGMILLSGCGAEEAIAETEDIRCTTNSGIITSVSGNAITISDSASESETIDIPDNVTIISGDVTIDSSELKNDDEVLITYTNGEVAVISVLDERSDEAK